MFFNLEVKNYSASLLKCRYILRFYTKVIHLLHHVQSERGIFLVRTRHLFIVNCSLLIAIDFFCDLKQYFKYI